MDRFSEMTFVNARESEIAAASIASTNGTPTSVTIDDAVWAGLSARGRATLQKVARVWAVSLHIVPVSNLGDQVTGPPAVDPLSSGDRAERMANTLNDTLVRDG